MNKTPKRSVGTGLPNGDDPAVYDKPRTAHEWRWEFLRRRVDYRADWAKVHKAWQQQAIEEHSAEWEHSNLPLPSGVTSWKAHFAHIAKMPGDAQCQKYGVIHLLDPACDWKQLGFSFFLTRVDQLRDAARETVPAHLRGWDDRFERAYTTMLATSDALERGDVITAYIDLRDPIKPQIDHLEAWAKEEQTEKFGGPVVERPREGQWRVYLRILDLERRGLSLDAIASHVYPTDVNVYPDYTARHRVAAALQRAHNLQDTFAIGLKPHPEK